LEELARGMGIREVALHVFGHNHAARALYEKAGYEITNINMTRTLDQGAR
jgi:ribosomal protein S18 acetylase RimI-like enzyme